MSRSSLGWHRMLAWRPSSVWARAGIVLLLVAPIAIAGTMMWALWDPSWYMRNIKLAVVNEDAGVESRGEYTNYGDQIVEGIKDTEYLNFTQVDASQAQEGLTRGTYMMVVTIPENFSEKAVTIISEKPERPEIDFATNDYYGTNSAIITASLVPQVQTKVENAITKKYADKVIAGLTKLSDGLGAAADGATRLDEGAAKLQDGGARAVAGIAKLDDGATQLDDGAGRLTAGTSQLVDGVGQLQDGSGQLADGAGTLSAGLDTLVTGTGTLADGAGQIEGGVAQLTDMLIPLLTQAQQASPQLMQAEQALRAAGMTEQANKLGDLAAKLDPANSANMVTQLAKLRDGTALLHHNLSDPNSQYLGGVLQLQDGAHRLADGATKLDAGVARLATGANDLNDGATQLAGGIGQLKDGTGQLRTGGGTLADGLNQLKNGTSELSTKLVDGAAAAPKVAQPDVSAQNMAVPIAFTETNAHPVQTIISHDDPTNKKIDGGVSLLLVLVFGFLIMLLLALVLPYYFGRAEKTRTPILSAWLIKTAASFVALVALALVSQAFGWHPLSWGAVALALLVIAATGAAVYQLFQVVFGRAVGGGFGLAFYALGVMVFGGVWPVTAVPAFLRAFHFVHPMTYAKTAFTRATDGITDGSYWSPLGALACFTIIALAISIGVLHTRRSGNAQLLRGQEQLSLAA